jgi:hypothetical protein
MTDAPEITPFAAPDRPDPDDIVASAWGDWVHDALVAQQAGARWFSFGDCGVVGQAQWGAVNAGAPLLDMPAGRYRLTVTAVIAAQGNANFGAHVGPPTPAAGAVNVCNGMSQSVVITYPYQRLIDVPVAGSVQMAVTWGYGGAGNVHLQGGTMVLEWLGPIAAMVREDAEPVPPFGPDWPPLLEPAP